MPRPEVLELGDQDALRTKFSEAGDAAGGAASKVTGAGTEKTEPPEHSISCFRGWGLFQRLLLSSTLLPSSDL